MSFPIPARSLPIRVRSTRRRAGGCLLALFAFVAPWSVPASSPAQQRTVLVAQESPLPDLPYGPETTATVVSPDGSRSVSVTRSDNKVTIRDGHPAISYDALAAGSPLLSGDGRHCAYAGRRESDELGEVLWYVVFDGNEKGPYFAVQPHSLAFRPDGLFFACVVGRRDGKEAVCVRWQDPPAEAPPAPADAPAQPATIPALPPAVPAPPAPPQAAPPPPVPPPVVHTEMGKWFDRVGDHAPRFSPDGGYLAYAALHDGAWRVLLNGAEGAAYDVVGGPRFCPSGAAMGYVGRRQGKSVAVTVPVGVGGGLGGEGPAHDSIGEHSLTYSFDGSHLAYVVGRPGAMDVFADFRAVRPGNPGAAPAPAPPAAPFVPFEEVAEDSLVFSGDGKHLAFAATRGGKWFVVLDGADGPGFAGVAGGPPAFSPDGKRLAYVAERVVPAGGGRREHVERFAVIDGVAQKPYDRIPAAPVFSADGKRYAYVAERAGQCFVVVDQMEGRPYRCIRGLPVFSADGSRCAFTALATNEDGRFSAAEEIPRDPTDAAAGSRLIFDRSPQFRGLDEKVMKQPVKLLLVEERVVAE